MSQLAQTIFAQRAEFYTTSAVHADQAVLDHIVELAQPKATDRVLDVGTGTGHTALAFAPHVAHVIASGYYTGDDGSRRNAAGQTRALRIVEFRIADAHELPFDDDVV